MADSATSGVTRRRLLAGAVGGIGGLAFFGLLPVLESLTAKVLGAAALNQATFARLVEAKRSPEGLKLNRYLRFAFARKPLPAIKTHGLQT